MTPGLTEQQDRALRLILEGARQPRIAAVLGVSRGRAREIVRRLCVLYGVDAMSELPDAVNAGAVPVVDVDDDDGRIHV